MTICDQLGKPCLEIQLIEMEDRIRRGVSILKGLIMDQKRDRESYSPL
jgi:hypothetical protein